MWAQLKENTLSSAQLQRTRYHTERYICKMWVHNQHTLSFAVKLLHFALSLCDPWIHRLCVTRKTINYNGGVHSGELCVSVLFLLDDAGLNKRPPTNTNSGSWVCSLTQSFVFLASWKRAGSESAGLKVIRVWRFTLWLPVWLNIGLAFFKNIE